MTLAGGEVLGRYEIVRLLGRGGMAEVYLAHMRGLGGFVKEVALKCVLPEVQAEADLTQMFLDEARTAARLEHPNIVQVFDIGQEREHLFFAMEYVRGTDARALLAGAQGRAVPLAQAIAIAIGTAAASHHAHELGVIHRDISPSNVLISSAGIVKLADFGIAKAASNRSVTQSGVVKGKLGYMSPEQCRGRALDRRSDIYSLGILMYQLTTGRLPFAETNPLAFVQRLATQDPTPPTQFVDGYPAELEQIVLRAIARDPADRYATAAELERVLERFATRHGLDVSARALAMAGESHSVAGTNDASLSPSFVTASVVSAASPELTVATTAMPVRPARRRRPRAVLAIAVTMTVLGGAFVAHRMTSTHSDTPPTRQSQQSPPPQPSAQLSIPSARPPSTSAVDAPPLAPAVASPATAAPAAAAPPARTQPTKRDVASKREPVRAQSTRTRARKSSEPSKQPAARSTDVPTSPDDPLPGTWRPN